VYSGAQARPNPVLRARSKTEFGNVDEAVLRKLFRALLIFLIIAAAATGIKAVFFNFKSRKAGDPRPCWSRDEAKRKGVWVCDVSVDPNTFQAGGTSYRMGEAWIEEAFEDDYFLVWFPQRTKLGWNRLCLRVPRYKDGAIVIENGPNKPGALYAGPDFQYDWWLEVGEYPTVQCQVRFWRWQPDEKVDLGTTVLKPQN
jgi:hypothetical protein